MKRQVNIQDATHVRTGDQIEKIADRWGVDEKGHLAPPSKGGFGVYTLSGRRLTMFEADEYLQEEAADKDVSALQAVTELNSGADWHNTETHERFGTVDIALVAAAYADCYEVARGHRKDQAFLKHGSNQMYWKGRSDAATEIRLDTPHNAKVILNRLINQAKAEARLEEAKWRLNHWPPFGVTVGSKDRDTAVEAYQNWISERADEQRARIAELEEVVKLAGASSES